MHPNDSTLDLARIVPSADPMIHWFAEIRDDLDASLDIADYPEEYGIVWRRLHHHLFNAHCIIADVIRVHLGEDPTQLEGGSIDAAMTEIETAAAEIMEVATRLERIGQASMAERRSGKAVAA